MNLPEGFKSEEIDIEKLTIEDKWILTVFNNVVKDVTCNLDKFELGIAAGNIQEFIWNIYCDWYIELTKPRILAGGENALVAQIILVYILRGMLKLLHPFLPFITEEIWGAIPENEQSIMISNWEKFDSKFEFKKESENFEKVINAISAIRTKRAELNVPPNRKVAYQIETKHDNFELFKNSTAFFEKLASASEIILLKSIDSAEGKAVVVTDSARIFMPMGELLDVEKERERLIKEMEIAQSDIDFVKKQLDNEMFVNKAPSEQVEKAREKLQKAKEKMNKIKTSLEALK
jgi:valyl-tRNA synthetase